MPHLRSLPPFRLRYGGKLGIKFHYGILSLREECNIYISRVHTKNLGGSYYAYSAERRVLGLPKPHPPLEPPFPPSSIRIPYWGGAGGWGVRGEGGRRGGAGNP